MANVHNLDGQGDRLGRVQSLVRAFGLLDKLAAHDCGLTLTEVARMVKLPRSTAHRLLTTMAELRYVEFDNPTSKWMIGVQAFALGSAFVQSRDIGRLGKPIMRSLMLETNEVVSIGVSEETGVRHIARAWPHGEANGADRRGARMPMHTTASGKVLLANWSPDERDHFLRSHPLPHRSHGHVIERNTLVLQLEEIRARGFAIDDQDHAPGMRCVAAPVFDHNRRVKASLSVSGSIERLTDSRLLSLGRTLAAAAGRMTDDIGAVLAA